MVKSDSQQATDTLHEIESVFDRLASWVAEHPVPVLLIVGMLLAVAAGAGGLRAWRADREADASAEVAAILAEYRVAMGAKPGAVEISEPANAEAAAATRREFATRLGDAAERLAGSTAAVTARLEAGELLEALGDRDGALAALRAAADAAPRGSVLEALARSQLGAALEAAGDAAGAAPEYLAAGNVSDFPGRVMALGNAARCFADAGQTALAIEVFGTLGPEEVQKLAPHISARLAELKLGAGSPSSDVR